MADNQNLINFITSSRQRGIPDEKIKTDLIAAGWKIEDIQGFFQAASPNPSPTISNNQPVSQPTSVSQFQTGPQAQQSIQQQYQAVITEKPKKKKAVLVSLVVALVVILIGGGVYAYVGGYIAFGAPYSKDNLVTGLVKKMSEIDTASNSIELKIYVEDREVDALPFDPKVDTDLKEKYSRDVERVDSVSSIISELRFESYSGKYPNSLASLDLMDYVNINDPLTKKPYEYKVLDGGNNFSLKVEFETEHAVSELRGMSVFSEGIKSQPVDGLVMNFDKDTGYIYIPSRFPKTFFEELSDVSQYLNPEFSIEGLIATKSGPIVEDQPWEWQMNLSGSGDMGDLTYKVDVEARKKAEDIFVRINNMPSIIASFLPPKGQWLRLPSDSETAGMFLGAEDLTETGEEFKEQQEEMEAFIRSASQIADEEGLFVIENNPIRENVDGRNLYRYELSLNKDAFLPFYDRVWEEIESNPELEPLKEVWSPTFRDQLVDEKFNETFNYYNKNTELILWVDSNGFPAIIKQKIRIVPGPEVYNLATKQVIIELSFAFDDINNPLEIEAPEEYKDYEEVMGGLMAKTTEAQAQSYLYNFRAEYELLYDTGALSFANKDFVVGKCSNTAGTIFANETLFGYIKEAAGEKMENITCASKAGASPTYAVSIKLESDPDYSFCVDSKGTAKEIFGTISGPQC